MKEKVYFAALHKIWFTHKQLFKLYENYKDLKSLYEKIDSTFLWNFWVKSKSIENIIKNKNNLDLSKLEDFIIKKDIRIIYFFDQDYPENLKNIFNPPFILYVLWDISLPWIAFIWSRNITSYGKKIIENFVPEIWKYFTIISGWAYGCDTYSHKNALNNNIKTIAVLWNGIDIDYPSENAKLYKNIVSSSWAIISNFPIWEKPNPYNFPIRNEIVAWLSTWIFIAEAKEKSGTLITAKLALDLWKDVFCVPWDIFNSSSSWCNNLLLNWEAKIVTKPFDILSEYNFSEKIDHKKSLIFTDELEQKIYDTLKIEAFSLDDLSIKLWIPVSSLVLKISIFELSWYIRKNTFNKYELI